jgi:two-component system, chemotaxis family, chemotaxis protein CheY
VPNDRQILVVDDDDDIRALVCLILEAEGYYALGAKDGVDALQILSQREPPGLILLDIMMPRMDGEAVVAELKASPTLSKIPVVMMSGDSHAREKTEKCCVQGCLVKPVDLDVLLRIVKQVGVLR